MTDTRGLELLTADEVAAILSISKNRAYELCRQGVLPTVRLGRQVRVDALELRRFIENGGKALPCCPQTEPPNANTCRDGYHEVREEMVE